MVFLWSFAAKSSPVRTVMLLICCPIRRPVLAPQSFINTPPSLFCIITMLTLIHSHLIAMIRLHLMLLHGYHLSLLFPPPLSLRHHGFLADLISVWCGPGLPLWIYEPSDFSPLIFLSSARFLHLSIYHSQGWLGRKSINPSIPSLTPLDRWGGGGGRWREEEEEG